MAVTEVVEAESLTRLEPDANLNGGGTNFICGHHAGTQGRSGPHLCPRENPVVRLRGFYPHYEQVLHFLHEVMRFLQRFAGRSAPAWSSDSLTADGIDGIDQKLSTGATRWHNAALRDQRAESHEDRD
jgi:hypothetical protein